MIDHEKYMERAIELAKLGTGNVSPNPMVGCVLVKNDKIIGEGFHEKFGGPHAEEMAIRNSFELPLDSTAYINLEPCCIESKTPPCTKTLFENGIKECFISILDPNPKIAGNGVKALKKYGIKVHIGLCSEVSKKLNKGFIRWITKGKPWVILKIAQSKNGFLGLNNSTRTQITTKDSINDVHNLRTKVDAVLVGKNTALVDNPKLTVRYAIGANPLRIILDTNRKLPLDLNVFRDQLAETIVLCSRDKFSNSRTSFCKYIAVKEDNEKLCMHDSLIAIAKEGVTTLLVESGPELIKSLLNENLIDEIYLYSSNKNLKNADLKNPLKMSDEWTINFSKNIGKDNLINAERKLECLQES